MNSEIPILPDPSDSRLTRKLTGLDQDGISQTLSVIEERPLTIFLNRQEIITSMTIGDYPEYLAIGFLLNQQMLLIDDKILQIDYDKELTTIVIRTERTTNYEEKIQKKVRSK